MSFVPWVACSFPAPAGSCYDGQDPKERRWTLRNTILFYKELVHFIRVIKFMDTELYSFIIFLMSVGSVVISFLSFLILFRYVFSFFFIGQFG